MKQLDDLGWNEADWPFDLCGLPVTYEEMQSHYGLSFYRYIEDGLGEFCVCDVEIAGIPMILISAKESEGCDISDDDIILVCISDRFEDSSKALEAILREFKMNKSDLVLCEQELGPSQWCLMRLDDNNNEIMMFKYLTSMGADIAKSNYERKGHKQTYFVRKL